MRITERRLRQLIRSVIKESYNHNLNESFIDKIKDWWENLTATGMWKETLDRSHVEDVVEIIEDHLGFDNSKIGRGSSLISRQCASAICDHFGIDQNSYLHDNHSDTIGWCISTRLMELDHTYGVEKSKRGDTVMHGDPTSYLDDWKGDGSVVKETAEHIVYLIQTFFPEAL